MQQLVALTVLFVCAIPRGVASAQETPAAPPAVGQVDNERQNTPTGKAAPQAASDPPSCPPPVCTSGCAYGGCCDQGNGCSVCGDDPLLKSLRGVPLFGDCKLSVGGELRYRYMDERDRLRPQGNLRRDTYNLWRFTPFVQVGNDWITGYVQAIDASIFGEDIPKLPIDENRADLLQYYVDVKLADGLRARVGRQFLKYGGQHLVSPLGWSNTFRNFEGGRLYYTSDDWSIDGFVTRPVNGAANNIFRPQSNDTPDQSALFSGVYATYKQAPGGAIDLYWLWLDEDQPRRNRHDGDRHAIGGRYAGSHAVEQCCEKLFTTNWDVESAYQFGTDNFVNGGLNQDVRAWFLSAIGGVTANRLPWTPKLTGLIWCGSGDDNPVDGEINTVTTLFPLGHAYWGLIDNFNGGNLVDYSVQLSVKPDEKLTYLAAFHWFDKMETADNIYNIAGAPLGGVANPNKDIGTELDLVATYAVDKDLTLQTGYSWFWYGDAVNTQARLRRNDAHQFYFMATWGF